MKKLYAIVSPAYTMVGDTLTDLSAYFVSPFHTVLFEQVCGYSLGHEAVFFEKIEDAKKDLEDGIKGSKSVSKTAAQKAILELDADDEGKITEFSKIHTADVEKLFEKTQAEGFFKAVRVPVWKERAIDAKKDGTPGALDEINSQYQESKKTVTEQATL